MNGKTERELDGRAELPEDEEDDFEYDENGDIIIPRNDSGDDDADDDTDDAADEEDGGADPEDDEESEAADEPESTTEEKPEENGAKTGKDGKTDEKTKAENEAENTAEDASQTAEPETDPETERKDQYIASLEAELRRLKSQTLDTLNKLGVKTDNAYDGLIGLAAETEGETLEEYRKRRAFAEREEEERAARNAAAFEEKMRQDLDEVQAAFPETKKYRSVKEFPNFAEFGRYRDAGLSPKKAFLASHEEEVRGSVASAVRRQALNETKNHLRSAVPKGSRDDSVKMTKKELSEWRGLFPEMSDREILALYRKTN